jgi:nitroreductase
MNPTLNAIFGRRCVRKYIQGRVTDEQIKDILEAAMAAPSACAKDPWHFIVVRDPATLKTIAEALSNGKFLVEASVGIVACGSLKEAHDNQLSYLLQDTAAAVENALLAASMLGLGACWLGVHPREERAAMLREVLHIPEKITPVAILSIGPPGYRSEPRTRYSEAKVHQEKW